MIKYVALKHWDNTTSCLHFGMAFAVTSQLLFAILMKRHIPYMFLAHEITGITIFFLVLIHWLWAYKPHQLLLPHLLPWNITGLKAIVADIKQALHGQLPVGGPRPGLPGFIHGLGLLAVTGMAFTGLIIFIGILSHHHFKLIRHCHSFMATLVWIYWYGHVALAILHRWLEPRVV